jgi:hypothetical protein
MKILLPYFSRSGHTEKLALHLAHELRKRGHEVCIEKIETEKVASKWRLTLPLLSSLPVLPIYLWSAPFRRWWHRHYPQPEQGIRPLKFPDASRFDCICLGGPKWLYIAYPVARYLQQIEGVTGKTFAAFTTFCGPPLEIFELEMLFAPLRRKIVQRGAVPGETLALSSHFHEFFFFHEMEYVFRLVSRLRFRRSLRSYTLESEWGQQEVQRFCNALTVQAPLQSGEEDAERAAGKS